jgi:hypothetical protein
MESGINMLIRVKATYKYTFNLLNVKSIKPIENLDELKESIQAHLFENDPILIGRLKFAVIENMKSTWNTIINNDIKNSFYTKYNGKLILETYPELCLYIENDLDKDNVLQFKMLANKFYKEKSELLLDNHNITISNDNSIIACNVIIELKHLDLI